MEKPVGVCGNSVALENLTNLDDVMQQEIIEHLEAALAAFRDVANGLRNH